MKRQPGATESANLGIHPEEFQLVGAPRGIGDLISYRTMEILHGGLPQGGEIVSEYSNAWIDMHHDNALNSALCR